MEVEFRNWRQNEKKKGAVWKEETYAVLPRTGIRVLKFAGRRLGFPLAMLIWWLSAAVITQMPSLFSFIY
ncbi:hypothetical protein SLE2022_130490 [Rubroshorea leprosula]